MKAQKQVEPTLLGAFEEQVMLAVVRTRADAYGMNVRRELEEVTGREVTIGSVYRDARSAGSEWSSATAVLPACGLSRVRLDDATRHD